MIVDAIVRSRVGTACITVASAVVTMMADAANDFPHLRNIDHRSPAPNPPPPESIASHRRRLLLFSRYPFRPSKFVHGIFQHPLHLPPAHAEDETLERARRVEPAGYVIKPFTERELRAVMEMALSKAAADQRLRDSEARYRHLMRELAVAVVVYAADGAIRDANQKACELLGIDATDLQGETAQEPGWSAVHEDDTPFAAAEYPACRAIASRASGAVPTM